jgi:hypothetical protein
VAAVQQPEKKPGLKKPHMTQPHELQGSMLKAQK